VVATGIVTTFAGHPLVLTAQLDEDELIVEIAFRTDPDQPGSAVGSAPRPGGWRVECVNFDDASGRGSAEPVLLGAIDDDLVFLHFRAFRYGRTEDHTVQFTLYRVAKEAMGWVPAG
jgi:hypothetical protein